MPLVLILLTILMTADRRLLVVLEASTAIINRLVIEIASCKVMDARSVTQTGNASGNSTNANKRQGFVGQKPGDLPQP